MLKNLISLLISQSLPQRDVLLEKQSHGRTEGIKSSGFCSTYSKYKVFLQILYIKSRVHGFPGSGIMSLFITKCLVTNISGEQNVEKSHIWIQTQWGDLSTHPYSNAFAAVKFRFDCWFSTDLWFLVRHPRGETICPQGCICSLLKTKNSCQIKRNQSRELIIWQWIEYAE